MYTANIDAAVEKFRALLASQLARVEDMKAQGDFLDYSALANTDFSNLTLRLDKRNVNSGLA